jgi:hypothetical protein
MHLASVDAKRFIEGYSLVMLEIAGGGWHRANGSILPFLAKGRANFVKDPTLLDKAIRTLQLRSAEPDPEVLSALRGLDTRQWIYLRDTKTYSIFLDPSKEQAYGVLGLTERIRDIVGGSGVVLETGLVRYRGRIVCDGLVSQMTWLGPSYRQRFNEKLRTLKVEGKFHAKVDA